MQLIEKPARKSLSQTHKKQKGNDQVNHAFTEWMKMKKSVNKSDQDAEQYFLLPILPDLKNLCSCHNKRTFKIQTMSLFYVVLSC